MFMKCFSTVFFNRVLQEMIVILFFNYVPQEMFMNCSLTMFLKKCSWIVLQLCYSRNVYELFFNYVIIHRSWIVCEQQIVTQELIEHSINPTNCKTFSLNCLQTEDNSKKVPIYTVYNQCSKKNVTWTKSLQRLTWQRTIMYKHSMSCDFWRFLLWRLYKSI